MLVCFVFVPFFFVVKALQKDKQVVCVENLPSKTKNVKNSN